MKILIAAPMLAALVAALLFSSPAPADPGCPPAGSSATPPSPDQLGHPLNYVLVTNCQPGAHQIDSRLQVRDAYGQHDQPTNLAYAYSNSCGTGCESVAVAYQVALVDENNTNQSPQNAAVAINDSCDGCATFAYADQYAVDVPPGTQLSPAVRRQLAQIGQEASQDAHADLPFSDLDSKLRALADQVKQVVDNGLQQENVAEHHPRQHQEERQTGRPGQGTSTTGTTSTTTTTSTTPTSATTG